MTATDILVIRHGESEWNAAGRWQGQADPPLTSVGRRQAEIASENVQGSFDLVASSDLSRAHETAKIIAARLAAEPVVTLEALRERHAGPWQGLTRIEINERWPGAIEQRTWPTGYELDDTLMNRVIPALRELAFSVASRALVVAHGGVIRALDRASGAPDESIPNLAGRWYRVGHDIEPGERIEFVPAGLDLGLE
ncbi:MAG: histidine phosphatase family protein [Actinomycetota bacterium]|nr:histidine phosphatase family protein [Actinomycetota bacterium]